MKLHTVLAPLGLAFVCNAIRANNLHSLQDTGNQTTVPSPLLMKRVFTDNKCRGKQAGWISQALADAPVAINRMIDRSKALIDFLNSNSKELPSDKLVVSTLHTFEAIFGQVWWQSHPQDNQDGADRVKKQIDRATKLAAALSSNVGPPIWEFYCNDNFLKDDDPFGDGLLQYEYWDNRPFDRGGQTTRNFENLQGNCRENKLGLVAYLEPSIGAGTESIVFCPNALDRFSGESLKSVREKAYSRGERNLDDIRDNVLAMNLLHELSHSRLVLGKDEAGKDNFYVDTPYSNGINGAAYGWGCVTEINESEEAEAENNADSFAFYVTAMYLDKNDWSTGVAADL